MKGSYNVKLPRNTFYCHVPRLHQKTIWALELCRTHVFQVCPPPPIHHLQARYLMAENS
ncbi:hypothetical protein YC2023_043633 [Brassica napus]